MSHRAADFGFTFEKLSYDWGKVIKRSRNVSDKLAGGIEFLFKKNKVDYVLGEATLAKAGVVTVKKEGWEGRDPGSREGSGGYRCHDASDAGSAFQRQDGDWQPGGDDP